MNSINVKEVSIEAPQVYLIYCKSEISTYCAVSLCVFVCEGTSLSAKYHQPLIAPFKPPDKTRTTSAAHL